MPQSESPWNPRDPYKEGGVRSIFSLKSLPEDAKASIQYRRSNSKYVFDTFSISSQQYWAEFVGSDEGQITFGSPIRAHLFQGPMVVKCSRTKNNVNSGLVAKIFDPVFYRETGLGFDASKVFLTATRQFLTEALAYQTLSGFSSQLYTPELMQYIPKYHGAFLLRMPGETEKRLVPLILMEIISKEQQPMATYQAYRFSKAQRAVIMERLLRVEALMATAGVLHKDITPENVMIDKEGRQLTILDFDVSEVITDDPDYKMYRTERPNQLLNPACRLFGSGLYPFQAKGWTSGRSEEDNKWLMNNAKAQFYVPVEPDEDGFPPYMVLSQSSVPADTEEEAM